MVMTGTGARNHHPLAPFQYAMVISFFESARETLDPVLQEIDGYRELETDQAGRPSPPEHIMRRFAALSDDVRVRCIGACLSATTSLGLAYVHSFRLLTSLAGNKVARPTGSAKADLVKLFDALPPVTQDVLSDAYHRLGTHDIEMEVGFGPLSEERRNEAASGSKDFRSTLAYWQSRRMLQDSHLALSDASRTSVLRIFIPLRSVLLLDHILAEHLAPRLGREYRVMDQEMSSRTEDPRLLWDGEMIAVSLPDKLGRTLDARWKPAVTSVIRIRESGTDAWSPGFETPFNMCSFAGLRPGTEYDVQVTHRNEAGESEPATTSIKTDPG